MVKSSFISRRPGSPQLQTNRTWKQSDTLLQSLLEHCVKASADAGRHGARPQHRRMRADARAGITSEGQDGPVQRFGSSSDGEELQAAIPSIGELATSPRLSSCFPNTLDTSFICLPVPADTSKESAGAAEEAATKAEAAKKAAATPLPPDFDWQSYILYHPELQDVGILSEEQAKEHYQQIGGRKKLLHRQIRVIMRYTACTGKPVF